MMVGRLGRGNAGLGGRWTLQDVGAAFVGEELSGAAGLAGGSTCPTGPRGWRVWLRGCWGFGPVLSPTPVQLVPATLPSLEGHPQVQTPAFVMTETQGRLAWAQRGCSDLLPCLCCTSLLLGVASAGSPQRGVSSSPGPSSLPSRETFLFPGVLARALRLVSRTQAEYCAQLQ